MASHSVLSSALQPLRLHVKVAVVNHHFICTIHLRSIFLFFSVRINYLSPYSLGQARDHVVSDNLDSRLGTHLRQLDIKEASRSSIVFTQEASHIRNTSVVLIHPRAPDSISLRFLLAICSGQLRLTVPYNTRFASRYIRV